MIDKNQKISVRPDGSLNVQTINIEKSMTQQQFKDECDINNIMAKYQSTGEFPKNISKQGIYADFAEIQDYQGMLDTVLKADEAFNTLPAPIRAKFKNDPASLISFLQDEKNYDEGVKLGLINQKPPPPNPNEPKPKTNETKPTT